MSELPWECVAAGAAVWGRAKRGPAPRAAAALEKGASGTALKPAGALGSWGPERVALCCRHSDPEHSQGFLRGAAPRREAALHRPLTALVSLISGAGLVWGYRAWGVLPVGSSCLCWALPRRWQEGSLPVTPHRSGAGQAVSPPGTLRSGSMQSWRNQSAGGTEELLAASVP